jgi:hypothetical protein
LAASAALKASLWIDSRGRSTNTCFSFPVATYSFSICGDVSRTCLAQNGHRTQNPLSENSQLNNVATRIRPEASFHDLVDRKTIGRPGDALFRVGARAVLGRCGDRFAIPRNRPLLQLEREPRFQIEITPRSFHTLLRRGQKEGPVSDRAFLRETYD